MFSPAKLLFFAGLALACADVVDKETIPSGALVVGSDGDYTTVQQAVDALDTSSTSEQTIFIGAGTYKEQVYIQKLAGPLTIIGETDDSTSYANNQVTITSSHALADSANDDATATLRVWTSNFKMYNVNVKNTYGQADSDGQALALSANAGNQGYYGCAFYGYQDTVLAESGAQLYGGCYIEGAVDFIFGQTAQAWFDNCDIGVLAASYGTITASGRASDDSGYYVINNSSISAAPGQTVSSGAYSLGRPWQDYARVVFQMTSMTDVVNQAGWIQWSSSDTRTDHVTFGEYDNTGEGAEGTRASFATSLSSPIAITEVLGSDYASASWVDTEYIS
ncbi:hypothetical protein LTR56_015243 [Elasticomyces elasticus]|nr:hypothetical protein LTR56_015243 [Elasticomyces elasticus]KAK3644294.1 hypothetical protein LTR22_015298 [Elasticomyces elasticus]KAK4908316.1 hypothetical protein LTR49_022796 [Elasticomyces elasticus]KAK5748322.1 hypothetical protein LTS12_021598 [Elasticomyces elasticus]